MSVYDISTGQPVPFGATPKKGGVNFSLYSEHAKKIDLCLFDELGQKEIQRIPLFKGEGFCWHVHVSGLESGALYGYRVHGDYEPKSGHRFNSNKLLLDPYARDIDRDFCWHESLYGYDSKSNQNDLSFSDKDNAQFVPKSVVCNRKSEAEIELIQLAKPNVAWEDTVVYEAHVRGFTQLNLNLPSELRGTIKGLSHPEVISYVKSLGVTAIELLPIQGFISESFLDVQGLSNFWGYNTLNFFTVHQEYLQSGKQEEFLETIQALHAEGIEVILDVVYNHTAESNEFGPTLNFRGIDNKTYYRLEESSASKYVNDTGCGNTLKADHPRVMQLILDSLRFWAGEMGVDGFRFDLAPILGREHDGFNTRSAFFQAISQDPLLSKCKLIAEPWDIGPGGYQLGSFPSAWSEWNDKYRDIAKRFWLGEKGVMPDFARRIHGSSDLFEHSRRGPRASLNFITSHDGFSLADLVSYNERHNLANKENNRDGHHSNFSFNYGVEGETDDVLINKTRRRQQRNLIATLLLSQGTPMLLAGDELGRSQNGNNNAYCQDNEINWLDWSALQEKNNDLSQFTAKIISLRKAYSLFTTTNYIHKSEGLSKEKFCARWVSPFGKPMTNSDWHHSGKNILGWMLKSAEVGPPITLLVLFNADSSGSEFILPEEAGVKGWRYLIDTVSETGDVTEDVVPVETNIYIESRSMKVLRAI